MILPCKGNITSPYGPRVLNGKQSLHKGLDFGWGNGRGLYATTDCIVSVVANQGSEGFGKYVTFIPDGAPDVRLIYAHCDSIGVAKGNRVKEGQTIGVMGETGNSSGVHLHFEVRKNNIVVSAAEYLGIKNEKGVPQFLREEEKMNIREETVKIGEGKVNAKLIDGVTYVELRPLIEAIKLQVTWSAEDGASVSL